MATVLITGGTGLIGTALTKELIDRGYKVIILTRRQVHPIDNKQQSLSYAHWNITEQTIDKEAIEQADYIIHLAGANVVESRWTEKRKQELVNSRVNSSRLVVNTLRETSNKVKAVISASAIGWYGPDPLGPNSPPFVETDKADESFLGSICRQWEESIEPVTALGKRLVKLRTGIVLSKTGGAYSEFKMSLKFGVAAILGSGKQVVSWIQMTDIVRMYITAMENENWQGAFNAVSPHPVTNKQLMLAIARAKGNFYIPVRMPEFALKLVLGEMSIEALKSATVSSRKAQDAGFQFQFPTIEAAVQNLNEGGTI